MGYVMVWGPCLVCKRTFAYNPLHVPSHPARGGKVSTNPDDPNEPICRPCVDQLNDLREQAGKPRWPIHAEAYEPAPEEEVF